MMDDRDAVAAFLADSTSLHAGLCIFARLLIGALGERHTFDPDAEPRVVHHDEHVFDAAVLLADQIAERTFAVAVGEHAGRARAYTELMLNRHAFDVVALAQAAVG